MFFVSFVYVECTQVCIMIYGSTTILIKTTIICKNHHKSAALTYNYNIIISLKVHWREYHFEKCRYWISVWPETVPGNWFFSLPIRQWFIIIFEKRLGLRGNGQHFVKKQAIVYINPFFCFAGSSFVWYPRSTVQPLGNSENDLEYHPRSISNLEGCWTRLFEISHCVYSHIYINIL